jgi:hypothetical protein
MKAHTIFVIGKCDMEGNAVSIQFTAKANLGTKRRDQAIADLM